MSIELANNFEEVLLAFNAFDVNYMIVGGYAVIFHGYPRTTGDLDLWVKPANENKKKIINAFKELKFSRELENYIIQTDFTEPFAVKLGEEPIQIDIFNAITGVKYDNARENAIRYRFSDKLESYFMNLDDLVINKTLTGRLQDKADVDQLQRIDRYRTDE
jgi:hypothetical protein